MYKYQSFSRVTIKFVTPVCDRLLIKCTLLVHSSQSPVKGDSCCVASAAWHKSTESDFGLLWWAHCCRHNRNFAIDSVACIPDTEFDTTSKSVCLIKWSIDSSFFYLLERIRRVTALGFVYQFKELSLTEQSCPFLVHTLLPIVLLEPPPLCNLSHLSRAHLLVPSRVTPTSLCLPHLSLGMSVSCRLQFFNPCKGFRTFSSFFR